MTSLKQHFINSTVFCIWNSSKFSVCLGISSTLFIRYCLIENISQVPPCRPDILTNDTAMLLVPEGSEDTVVSQTIVNLSSQTKQEVLDRGMKLLLVVFSKYRLWPNTLTNILNFCSLVILHRMFLPNSHNLRSNSSSLKDTKQEEERITSSQAGWWIAPKSAASATQKSAQSGTSTVEDTPFTRNWLFPL